MTDFDPNWPHGHVTRDGRKARIISTNAVTESWPIIALVATKVPRTFTSDGRCSSGRGGDDLLNAPALKRKVRVRMWLNVLPSGVFYRYTSREGADRDGSFYKDRIACIEIDREVEEGEGL